MISSRHSGSLLAVAVFMAGCGRVGALRARINSEDSSERILAIRQAGDQKDVSAVRLLVDRLEDEDAAVRLFAIAALEKITGQRFGYDYGQSAELRAKSVKKWRQYVRSAAQASRTNQPPLRAGGTQNGAA